MHVERLGGHWRGALELALGREREEKAALFKTMETMSLAHQQAYKKGASPDKQARPSGSGGNGSWLSKFDFGAGGGSSS